MHMLQQVNNFLKSKKHQNVELLRGIQKEDERRRNQLNPTLYSGMHELREKNIDLILNSSEVHDQVSEIEAKQSRLFINQNQLILNQKRNAERQKKKWLRIQKKARMMKIITLIKWDRLEYNKHRLVDKLLERVLSKRGWVGRRQNVMFNAESIFIHLFQKERQ